MDNYVEPFAGSLAVLLARPDDRWLTGAETVNDVDCYLENFWRAVRADPDAVAEEADRPVNETDLLATHIWLVNAGRERIEKLESDPDYYDVKVAARWVVGINSWIGSGWCKGDGPWCVVDGAVRQLPHLGSAGRGVNRQLPHLGDAGQGVNRKRPHLGNRGNDKPGQEEDVTALTDYFRALSTRLRRVRVCCGDWRRVLTDGAMAYGDTVGIFLDPPYLGDVRAADLYRCDDHTISHEVREWALAQTDPRLRIVLAGYAPEHEAKMPPTWRMHAYKANAAYQNSNSTRGNADNRKLERLWFSPSCREPEQGGLFRETQGNLLEDNHA